MIETKELRIGNLVKCTVHLPIGYNRPVIWVADITEVKESSVETNHGNHKLRDIAPIPLTEDILVKCGGEKLSDTIFVFKDTETEHPEFHILISTDKFYLCTENGNKLSIPIESVHHFQNLYYVIRGKDVKLTL